MHEQVPAFSGALTANGGADGTLTFASNTGIYPGARGYLSSSSLNQYVLVVSLVSTTGCRVRFIAESTQDPKINAGTVRPHTMGFSDCSGFTTAQSAKLELQQQVVPVKQPQYSPADRP
jgi:hypothetical protein